MTTYSEVRRQAKGRNLTPDAEAVFTVAEVYIADMEKTIQRLESANAVWQEAHKLVISELINAWR